MACLSCLDHRAAWWVLFGVNATLCRTGNEETSNKCRSFLLCKGGGMLGLGEWQRDAVDDQWCDGVAGRLGHIVLREFDPLFKGSVAFIEKLFDHKNLWLRITHETLDGWLVRMPGTPASRSGRESSSNCHETGPPEPQGQV
jgi:hypothetical protein